MFRLVFARIRFYETMKIYTYNEAETRQLAQDLAKKLRGGEILALVGDLGSGKTTFVKGLARGFAIRETIRSPTFVLMKIFIVKKSDIQYSKFNIRKLVHIDAYRLRDASELEEIGTLDYLGKSNTLTVIEWPERVKNVLKKLDKKVSWIKFDYGEKENERIIKL